MDYVSVTGELLTFSASVTRQDVIITLNDDDINEGTESFVASAAFVGIDRETLRLTPEQATIQIIDDDSKLLKVCYNFLKFANYTSFLFSQVYRLDFGRFSILLMSLQFQKWLLSVLVFCQEVCQERLQ